MKNPRKHYCLEDYKSLLNPLLTSLNRLSNMVGNPIDHPDKNVQIELYNHQIFIARSAVIQYFVVLDASICKLLYYRQSDLGKAGDQIRDYTEIDVGLKELMTKEERTKEFDKLYTRITHFRGLRNQFAHYPNGAFSLGANRESFESFLEKLDGIEIDPERGWHCYIDGKAGFVLPYTSTSSEFINDLLKTGTDFYKLLLDIFIPDYKEDADNSH